MSSEVDSQARKNIRETLGLSHAELAAMFQVGRRTVHAWECPHCPAPGLAHAGIYRYFHQALQVTSGRAILQQHSVRALLLDMGPAGALQTLIYRLSCALGEHPFTEREYAQLHDDLERHLHVLDTATEEAILAGRRCSIGAYAMGLVVSNVASVTTAVEISHPSSGLDKAIALAFEMVSTLTPDDIRALQLSRSSNGDAE